MTSPFIGEIRMFAGNFPPRGWAYCDGQLLPVAGNDALFSLLGTIYGGDGATTFALPDLRGRLPVHTGTGPGLSPRPLGQLGGSQTAGVTTAQLPSHSHDLRGVNAPGASQVPTNAFPAAPAGVLYAAQAPDTPMKTMAVGPTGSNAQHENRMPSLCIHFIIALTGVFPTT